MELATNYRELGMREHESIWSSQSTMGSQVGESVSPFKTCN